MHENVSQSTSKPRKSSFGESYKVWNQTPTNTQKKSTHPKKHKCIQMDIKFST